MTKVNSGDTVKVHYIGKLKEGEVFDSSRERNEPFIFKTGHGMVIPGFNDAVVGMMIGEIKKVTIPPAEGYGDRLDEFVLKVPKNRFPEGADLTAGMTFALNDGMGRSLPATIVEITGDDVTLDANHPLAGKTLMFEIELLEIGCALPKHAHCHDDSCGGGCCG